MDLRKSSILREGIYVHNKIDKKKMLELYKYISMYIDRNSEVLSTPYLSMIYFTENDKNIVYKTLGLSKSDIQLVVKQIPDLKDRHVTSNPFAIAITNVIKFMIDNKYNRDHISLVAFYFAIFYYPSVFTRQFPNGVIENIMRYTIDNLSDKYDIKKDNIKTLTNMFIKKSMTCVETYEKDLMEGNDFQITNFISQMSGRIKDTVKNIANEYYENHKDKKYINIDNESLDEDDFHTTDSNTMEARRIIDKTRLKISEEGTDPSIIKIVKKLESDVSEKEIHNAIIKINKEHYSEVNRLIHLIVDVFVSENDPNKIKDSIFFTKCMEIYSRSNTTDTLVIEIKSILDKLLLKTSDTYRKSNRTNTINSYKKSLYTYYVLVISKASKN